MDKITLQRMQFFGYHGVFPEENKLGQRYIVDLEMLLDLSKACRTDAIEDTLNYGHVFETVKAIVEGPPFKLVEALAEKIASQLLELYTNINEVTVRVSKPHPPVPVLFEGFTVEIRRNRESLRT